MLDKFPLLWILVGFCLLCLLPITSSLILDILAPLFILVISLFVTIGAILASKLRPGLDASLDKSFTAFLENSEPQRRRFTIRLYQLFCLIPPVRYNPYALGLASCLVEYANSLCTTTPAGQLNAHGSKTFTISANRLRRAPAISLYEQSLEILQSSALSDKGDLVLIHCLLAHQLYYCGSRSEALESQMKGAQIYQTMNDKELAESVQSLIILGEGLVLSDQGDTELTEKIATHTLSVLEDSPVGKSPKDQLVLLSKALSLVSVIYKSRQKVDQSEYFIERYTALTAALKSKGVAV